MHTAESLHPALFSRLIDGLYVEALVMADEARAYFDRAAEADKTRYDTMTRLSFTCESLKVTTRLMHVIAWLMTQKAWQRGEIATDALGDTKYRLGPASETDRSVTAIMPVGARQLVEGSQALYQRVLRLQGRMESALSRPRAERDAASASASPALELIGRLEKSF
jgi:regulator of CtrA degradation